jgi:hypothetical protein
MERCLGNFMHFSFGEIFNVCGSLVVLIDQWDPRVFECLFVISFYVFSDLCYLYQGNHH